MLGLNLKLALWWLIFEHSRFHSSMTNFLFFLLFLLQDIISIEISQQKHISICYCSMGGHWLVHTYSYISLKLFQLALSYFVLLFAFLPLLHIECYFGAFQYFSVWWIGVVSHNHAYTFAMFFILQNFLFPFFTLFITIWLQAKP